MYCNRLNFTSTWICASAPAAKKRRHVIAKIRLITLLNDETRMTQLVKTLKEFKKLQRLRIATLLFNSVTLVTFVPRGVHGAELFSAAGKSCKSREGSA